MTKVKLADGTIINAEDVVLENGILKISTTELTVEELAELFSDKSNTSNIVIMTETGKESGYKKGFTSFAGIMYGADGTKTVEMFQPVDVNEARISNAEGAANAASEVAKSANSNATNASAAVAEVTDRTAALEEQNAMLTDCILEMSEMLYV